MRVSQSRTLLVATLSWHDLNASNATMYCDVYYCPASGTVTLIGTCTGSLSGLGASSVYALFTIPDTRLLPPASSNPVDANVYLSNAATESIKLDPATGTVVMQTSGGTSSATSRYPRFALSYPARGGPGLDLG